MPDDDVTRHSAIRLRSEALYVVSPGRDFHEGRQPHCANHDNFHSECLICQRALANVQPYPIRKDNPVSRSFGFTDNITAEKLRLLDPKMGDVRAGDPEYSLSLVVLRTLWRLVWPFRR